MAKVRTTVGEVLHWCYANLAMSHAAFNDGASAYGRTHYMVRSRLLKGLTEGTMAIGSLVEEERVKLLLPRACCYCGADGKLSVDHLIPTSRGGADSGDNIVWACRPCNSSKGAQDVLTWYAGRGEFPPLLLLRRYLKLVIDYSAARNLMGTMLTEVSDLPFDLKSVPEWFPAPGKLVLWQVPLEEVRPIREAIPGAAAEDGDT